MRLERLRPTRVSRRYLGGQLLDQLRGGTSGPSLYPEDWIGSVTLAKDGGPSGDEGLSRLADGRLFADVLREDPEGWLGAAHVARHGAHPGVLVKLLDPQQRLPVHAHPHRDFARERLDHPHGKTEAWIVVATRGESAEVWLGMRQDVDRDECRRWIEDQQVDSLLGAMNHVHVRTGDVIYVPGGVPHAIGAGLLVVELQEPTDWSIHLEWEGYASRAVDTHTLGLGWEGALDALELRAWEPRLGLPEEAREYFWVERSPVPGRLNILVVTDGQGEVGGLEARAGDTFVLPAAASAPDVEGELELFCCLGPAA